MKRVGQVLGLLLAAVLLSCLVGCATSHAPEPCEPVFVSDYTPEDPLPEPTQPEDQLQSVEDDAEWKEWLEAIGVGHAEWKAYALELLHIIRSHNRSIPEGPEPPG
jgi:hypothetical protein